MKGKNDARDLMIKVARMHYVYGISQKNIAEQTGFSRGYICQLLDRAKEVGIVEIKVNTWLREESELEKSLRESFKLRKVIAISRPQNGLNPELLQNEIISETYNYLDSIVRSSMTIAFSWGRTIYRISQTLKRSVNISNVEVVPLCGGTSNLNNDIFVSEISKNIAHAYNGIPLSIPLPAILENEEIKRSVYSDTNVKQVLDKICKADIALFTVGEFGEQSSIYLGGYIDNSQVKSLQKKGAVGDICAHFINAYGEICDMDLDNRTVSINLKDFIGIPNKILIAYGEKKVLPLLGALRKNYADVVITDEDTIKMLQKHI